MYTSTTVNQVILLGTVTEFADLKTLPSGALALDFSVVTQYRYKDKMGQYKDQDTYHKIVAFGQLAQDLSLQLTPNTLVHIQGRLQNESYTDKSGQKRWITKVIANQVIVCTKDNTIHTQNAEKPEISSFVDDLPF